MGMQGVDRRPDGKRIVGRQRAELGRELATVEDHGHTNMTTGSLIAIGIGGPMVWGFLSWLFDKHIHPTVAPHILRIRSRWIRRSLLCFTGLDERGRQRPTEVGK